MAVANYFAASYVEAREKFLVAARTAAARLGQYKLPNFQGPDGEDLTTDVAMIGAVNPERLLIVISGTHGVEGFCGSGCQTGYLIDRLYEALPAKSAVLLVHALNPFGFAWLRRVTEENIDLNRNFHNFNNPLPPSENYKPLHSWLVPGDWTGPQRKQADTALLKYINQKTFPIAQAEITGGQHTHSDGLFYGGVKETWSNRTLREILAVHVLPSVNRLAVLDIHTGLGPAGYGEPIYLGPTLEGLALARKWYGPEVKTTLREKDLSAKEEDQAISAPVTGAVADALPPLRPDFEVNYLALEFGTKGPLDVLTALRGDNWLHLSQDCDIELRKQIKRNIRDAFYLDTFWWRAAVYGRTCDFSLRSTRALT